MSLNTTTILEDKSGTVKVIRAASITRDMRANAIWHSIDAREVISVPTVLSNSDLEWLAWAQSNWIKIRVEPDSGGPDGQGLNVECGPATIWSVDQVPGSDVFIVRSCYLNQSVDDRPTIYNNPDRIQAKPGDVLYRGDVIVGAASGQGFTVRIEYSKSSSTYIAFGVVQNALA